MGAVIFLECIWDGRVNDAVSFRAVRAQTRSDDSHVNVFDGGVERRRSGGATITGSSLRGTSRVDTRWLHQTTE